MPSAKGDRSHSATAELARTRRRLKAVADEKQYLRAVLSEARLGLSAVSAGALSARVQQRLLSTDAYLAAAKVVLYAPLGREVETDLIAADALRSHRQLYYPIADRKHRRIGLGAVSDLSELRAGAFGILEPPTTGALEAEALGAALVCVPGIAFTPDGARLGRGGGYYDRLLAALSAGAVTAGLGYSFQLIDHLPEQARDRRLDFIVTESAVYATSGAPPAVAQATDQGGLPKWAC
jgi:5-formyltetrahydrofolate cyclo-ligase